MPKDTVRPKKGTEELQVPKRVSKGSKKKGVSVISVKEPVVMENVQSAKKAFQLQIKIEY